MPASRLASVLAALVLTLVACTGATTTDEAPTEATPTATETETAEGSDDDALQRVADAAQTTVDEGTAAFRMYVETEGTGGEDGRQPIEAEGVEDFDADQREVSFIGPQGQLDMIVDGSEVYLQLPLVEDDQWLRIELDELLDDEAGIGGPAGLPFQDPQANLEVLQSAVTSASEAGSEDVDGESTTRYDLTVDLTGAAAEATDDTRAALEQLAAGTGAEELDMAVFIDGEDRIRRLTYQLDLDQVEVREQATGSATEDAGTETGTEAEDDTTEEGGDAEVEADPQGTVSVTIDYTDFGLDVTIEVPSDDQVVDLDEGELRNQLEGAGTGGTGGTATEDATEATEQPTED